MDGQKWSTMREKYESLSLADLREIAKIRGIKGTSVMKKAEIIDVMVAMDEKEAVEKNPEKKVSIQEDTRQGKDPDKREFRHAEHRQT